MSRNSIRVIRVHARAQSWLAISLAALAILFAAGTSLAQSVQTGFAQRNVNTAGLTPTNSGLYAGNPLKQMNEPFCINASVNKNVVVCGSNDYSGVDDPGLGDSWVGLHWSTDAGQTFNRGLLPCHLYDSCSVGAKYAADPNLSEAPGALFYSFIGGWRNGEQRSGMWMTSHYYTNGETGMPYRFRRIDEIALGTGGEGPGGKFLDKPGQALSLAAPGTQPDVDWQIPAWTDPTDPSRSVEEHTLSIPAGSLHFTFSVFTGNDNNPGTKIQYYRYDNWDFSAPAVVEKLSEGVEINQGTSIATRNNGKDVMVVWRRFSDDPKVPSAILYTLSTRYGARPSKPQVLAELCGMDQPTGRARYRASSLPIVTSDEDKFLVFYADKSEVAGRACTDSEGVDHVNVGTDGNPDNDVLARLDYSRIRMATWDGNTKSQGEAAWDFELVDPRLDANGHRLPGHQLTPAATTAGGITTVVWDDNKDSVLYRAAPPSFFDSPRPFVQDYVLTQEFGLVPSSAYEDPANDLPVGSPFRQSVDIWGLQVRNSAPGQAFKVSRYARGLVRGADGSRTVQQLEYNFPNGRLFRQGSRPFFADYKTVAAAAWRLVSSSGQSAWDSNADEPAPGSNTFFQAPVFYAGFTDNRGVRGDVYYNGCDENDPAANCSNEYALPNPPPAMAMAPLEGEEDPSRLGICTADSPTALSRNQSVYVAAIRPGIALTVLSARKPDNGKRGYALYAQNSTSTPIELVLSVPDSAAASFDRDTVATDDSSFLRSLTVNVPPFSGSVRTVYVFGEDGDPQLIPVTATDTSGALEPVFTTLNSSVDSPLLNVEVGGVSVVDSEVYNLSLLPTRVISNQDFENQDFENTGFLQDFENSVILQDFENETLLQDFENTTVLQDFENQDFENAVYQAQDFENAGELQDFENQDFENQAFVLQDFENVPELQDFENQDFENFNILYQDFENQDFENSPPTGEDELNEYSWTVSGDNNTTAGFNVKPLASPGSLDGVRTQLIVSKTSYNLSVAQNPVLESSGLFCTPQYVAQNQVVYSKVTEDSGTIGNVVADPGLDPEAASFFLAPGEKAVVTLRVYGPQVNVGVGVWAQADEEVTDCTAEVGGDEVDPACEVDFLDVDETPPEIVVLGANPQIVEAGAGAYSDPNPAATATDDRDGDITGSILVDTSGVDTTMPGTYLVTYTVQDLEGNSASATRAVNVVDTTAPLLTVPADVLVEATAPDSSIDIGLASATDFVGPVTIVSDAPALFPVGTTVVTWTATDDYVNTSTATQNIVVQDSTPPALIGPVPANPLLVEANDASGWVYSVPLMPVWPSISYADVVSGTIGAVCSPTATSDFPLGDTEVTCSAIDGAANAGVPVIFTVTVQDTMGPTLPDFPGGFDSDEPFVVQFDQSTFTLEWGPFDVDDTDPMLDVSCSLGSLVPDAPLYTFVYDFPVGTTEVTCTAEDSAGNEVTGSFTVNVADETGPVFTIDETELVVTTAGTTASVDYLANISASDVVDGPIDDTDLVCTVDGEAQPSPFDFALGATSTVSCTATDASDNSTTASFTVAVNYIYGIVIEPIKGNVSAGSTVPVDWYYVNPETGNRVNTPTISPSVEWFGTFSERNCAGTNSGDNDGAEDAGSSRVRYTSSDSSWRLNWQTPPTAGWYELVITPPGTDEATVCVRTR